MFKYLPTPAQLKRWRNETTFILTFAMGAAETLRDYVADSDPSDPIMWVKGLAIVIVGLVQRWNAYGKETIEKDLPAMAEATEGVPTWLDEGPAPSEPGRLEAFLLERKKGPADELEWLELESF